jgi:hypothetical protein
MATFAAGAEIAQWATGLGRTASLADAVAGWAGVAAAPWAAAALRRSYASRRAARSAK